MQAPACSCSCVVMCGEQAREQLDRHLHQRARKQRVEDKDGGNAAIGFGQTNGRLHPFWRTRLTCSWV